MALCLFANVAAKMFVWRVNVTACNDSAIFHDCSVTSYWHRERLYQSISRAVEVFVQSLVRKLPGAPDVSFIWERSVFRWLTAEPLHLFSTFLSLAGAGG